MKRLLLTALMVCLVAALAVPAYAATQKALRTRSEGATAVRANGDDGASDEAAQVRAAVRTQTEAGPLAPIGDDGTALKAQIQVQTLTRTRVQPRPCPKEPTAECDGDLPTCDQNGDCDRTRDRDCTCDGDGDGEQTQSRTRTGTDDHGDETGEHGGDGGGH